MPGSEVRTHGLRIRAEGGHDHRGRVRIGTVLVSPIEIPPDDEKADDTDD